MKILIYVLARSSSTLLTEGPDFGREKLKNLPYFMYKKTWENPASIGFFVPFLILGIFRILPNGCHGLCQDQGIHLGNIIRISKMKNETKLPTWVFSYYIKYVLKSRLRDSPFESLRNIASPYYSSISLLTYLANEYIAVRVIADILRIIGAAVVATIFSSYSVFGAILRSASSTLNFQIE